MGKSNPSSINITNVIRAHELANSGTSIDEAATTQGLEPSSLASARSTLRRNEGFQIPATRMNGPASYMEEGPPIEEWSTNDPTRKRMRLIEHVTRMLAHLDPDPERAGVRETPERVARMWVQELTAGYQINIAKLFRVFPDENYQGQVVIKDIPVTSVCEHHLVPIVGYAHIGYFPDGRIVGLSKLPRLVDAFARRLQVQERLTQQIVDAIEEHLAPRGTIVVIEAEHMCMTMRGVQAPGTKTVTCTVTGLYADEQGIKEEFLELTNRNGGH